MRAERSTSGTPLYTRLLIWGARRRLIEWLLSPNMIKRIPQPPRVFFKRMHAEPVHGRASLDVPELPNALRTIAGIEIDDVEARASFERKPLYDWPSSNLEALHWDERRNWLTRLLDGPIRARAGWRDPDSRLSSIAPTGSTSPAELTVAVKKHAEELGLSAVGVAEYDPKFTFAPYRDRVVGDTVIVCVLEQNWTATQTVPSTRAELAHNITYTHMYPMVVKLAEYIRQAGYQATPWGPGGPAMSIHYGVAAGLGQLGLNGQLLTPFAGSRCRLMLITTKAPLTFDSPKDFGIHAVCDACQACVRRCPPGAISSQRRPHRGVVKAKIKMDRCMPTVAQVQGCAICMKVCPVQRYGLPAVVGEFSKTGRILGRDSDELEGYVWPLDGKYYGPGEKPKEAVTKEFLRPVGFVMHLDDGRTIGAGGGKASDADLQTFAQDHM